MKQRLTIDPEFKALIPPLSSDELAGLEKAVKSDGCLSPLVVWRGKNILLDGHNRYAICERNGIDFEVVEVEVADRDAACDWIDTNQLGRRNLSDDQKTMILGRVYQRSKKSHGGTGANQHVQSGQIDHSAKTSDRLAKQFNVSEKTVRRAGDFAAAVEKTKAIDRDIEKRVVAGTAPPKAAVIKAAAILEKSPEKAQALLNGTVKMADVIREQKREEVIANLESIAAKEIKATAGVYDVIVIDPPWPMQKIERDVRPNQNEFDYPKMTIEQITEMKLPTADDCHVFVWTTQKFLPVTFDIIKAWGLKYIFCMAWKKPGGFQPIGLPQYNMEFCLYARKGTPQFVDTKAFMTCFEAPRGAHSEKPEAFYDVIRRVTAGRRIDMFNRRVISGFETWGLESK